MRRVGRSNRLSSPATRRRSPLSSTPSVRALHQKLLASNMELLITLSTKELFGEGVGSWKATKSKSKGGQQTRQRRKGVRSCVHSDNAPSHFKCSKTMHFLTKLPERLKEWGGHQHPFRVVWEFGAPGHGKGVWDGIGAWMKRTVRQDVVDHTPSLPTAVLTSDGHILSPKQVYEHLKARFQTEEYVQSHANKTINEVVVEYTRESEIVRPKPDYEYDRLPDINKTFLFMAIREGVILKRRYSCWCIPCLEAWAPGEGSMDTNYVCHGCESENLPWEEMSIERTDAAGISNARRRTLNKARALTEQLKNHFSKSNLPVWVAVQNRGECDEDQYWIGRALRIKRVYDFAGSVEETGGRVRYDAGDCEVEVEWFERHESGGDERRVFVARDPDGHTYTFNSTELRLISTPHPSAISLEMMLVPPIGGVPLNVVQYVRQSPRLVGATVPNYRNVRYHVGQVRASRPTELWEISAGIVSALSWTIVFECIM